jgi:hypothetical protein
MDVGPTYLFNPNGDAQPIIEAGGHMVLSKGLMVQEVYPYPKTTWEKTSHLLWHSNLQWS